MTIIQYDRLGSRIEETLMPSLFLQRGCQSVNILNRSTRAIFGTLDSSGCCVPPAQCAGLLSRTPGTPPPRAHKLDAGAGKTLLLHPRPRNRKSTTRPKQSPRAALRPLPDATWQVASA